MFVDLALFQRNTNRCIDKQTAPSPHLPSLNVDPTCRPDTVHTLISGDHCLGLLERFGYDVRHRLLLVRWDTDQGSE